MIVPEDKDLVWKEGLPGNSLNNSTPAPWANSKGTNPWFQSTVWTMRASVIPQGFTANATCVRSTFLLTRAPSQRRVRLSHLQSVNFCRTEPLFGQYALILIQRDKELLQMPSPPMQVETNMAQRAPQLSPWGPCSLHAGV